jgi:hypothetical protein
MGFKAIPSDEVAPGRAAVTFNNGSDFAKIIRQFEADPAVWPTDAKPHRGSTTAIVWEQDSPSQEPPHPQWAPGAVRARPVEG